MAQERIIPVERVERLILIIRGKRVVLDADLARLYGVTTKRLNEQVKRNAGRFPQDFMFRLTEEEKTQVVAKCDHLGPLKFSKTLPYAFTEHGTIMAASILNSQRAIDVSLFVVRAFVRLRDFVATRKALSLKLEELERKVATHDESIRSVFQALRQLMAPPPSAQRRIGFVLERSRR
jgi:hypothetical protein